MRLTTALSVALQLALFPFAGPATGQNPSYSAPQGGTNERVQELIDELRAKIDEAERMRKADPWFLRDLRSLLRRYDYPWRVQLVSENFRDGDYTNNPSWTVAKGEFSVPWGGGLATSVRPRTVSSSPSGQTGQQGDMSVEDAAIAIFGELLKRRSDAPEQGRRQAPVPQQVIEPAEIYLPQRVTQAFAITAVVSGRPSDGKLDEAGLELGVYGGEARNTGYRLSYTPGEGIALLRSNWRGSSVIEATTSDVALIDGKDHVIEWTRMSDGQMAVRLDGTDLFATTDRSFRQDFSGFHVINRGGDYLLRSVTINGTN